ncbi:uncharacterized protein LOC116218576 isoform X2 [Clupea harengus]|uniref:Uncharacterized protein LOC116218576 isoform X2 n=1 Tax=Clupea harengus TaxID=7950 RepID=A0A6P8EX28_CLUHA|nr:uncharacterized protein LOC116218576 isoform X2 [Clupea harengus]
MWILILIPFLLAEPSTSTSTSLDLTHAKGVFNTTVILPCQKPCHGVVKWVKARPLPPQTIAHCVNGTCADFGNKATVGLFGNIFLSLPQAALTDEGWYEGHCDDEVICDITLELSAHNSTAEVHKGDALSFGLLSSEPVRVTFRKAGVSNSTDDLVCVVEGAVPLCVREYSRRSSVQDYTVIFTNVTESDEGVFTVIDSNTTRILNTMKLTIKNGSNLQKTVPLKVVFTSEGRTHPCVSGSQTDDVPRCEIHHKTPHYFITHQKTLTIERVFTIKDQMNEDVGTFKDTVNVTVSDIWQLSILWQITLFVGGFLLNMFLWRILAFARRTYNRIKKRASTPPNPEEKGGLPLLPCTGPPPQQTESELDPEAQTKDNGHLVKVGASAITFPAV